MKKKLLFLVQLFLAKCAKFYLYRNKPFVIGITWSVGKTSCRMIVSWVLKKYLKDKTICTSEKNFNSELGLVFSIFQIKNYTPWIKSLLKLSSVIFFASIFRWKKYDILILEYWVDHPWDMDFLLNIVKPDFWIFTKLDKIHSVYFQTENWIWDEKIKLLKNTKKKVFLNPLDDFCNKIFKDISWKKDYFQQVDNYNLIKENDLIQSCFDYKKQKFYTNLIGKENIDYIWLAFQILEEFWEKPKLNDFVELNIQSGRFSVFKWVKNSVLIDSTYNAWPESMKKMIENIFFIKEQLFKEYKIILVLWEMRELWDDIVWDEHKKLAKYITKSDAVYLIWKQMDYLYEELKNDKFDWFYNRFLNSKKTWLELKEYIEKNNEKYIILFKWSQNTIFSEEALKQVLLYENDETKLVRQSKSWMKIKNNFYNWLK